MNRKHDQEQFERIDEAVFQRRADDDLLHDDESRAIAHTLTTLQSMPAPQPPADLAARCLSSQPRRSLHWMRLAWGYGAALLLIFLVGVGLGRYLESPPSNVQQLITQQEELIAEIENQLEASNAPPVVEQRLTALSHTSTSLAQSYQQNRGDLVFEQRLSEALAHSLQLLRAMQRELEEQPRQGVQIWQRKAEPSRSI